MVLSRPDLAWLIAENVRLREENQALRAESIQERQQAHYYQSPHRGATKRLEEREKQIEALKAKVSEQIEWEVRLLRRRTKRNKYRRPKGCTCKDDRPDIVCAPAPASLIPKGLLAYCWAHVRRDFLEARSEEKVASGPTGGSPALASFTNSTRRA